MHAIHPAASQALHGTAASRRIEQAAQAASPPHALMQRAGEAVARLALALAPHSRTVWIACGPGNNGGDGFEAALHLQRWGKQPHVTWLGDEAKAPADALASLARMRAAGVQLHEEPPSGLGPQDLAIDALLGLGATRAASGRLLDWIACLNAGPAPVLAVDLPTGLDADHGTTATDSIAAGDRLAGAGGLIHAQNTLSLLTLKPGLFTGHGRDAAGRIWFDDLGCAAIAAAEPADAWLAGEPVSAARLHASHKGSWGDVAVLGGAPGMAGAALMAATAALHGGAGRVFAVLLDAAGLAAAPLQPELMLRPANGFDWTAATVVAGCGGGDAVRAHLPAVLEQAPRLVLDADALNALAQDAALQALLEARAARGAGTVLTPHPLEAARLLGRTTAQVQARRLETAMELAARFNCTAVLKGSGSVIATPGHAPVVNPTGNARLATAGTGDVLAGLVGARLAAGLAAHEAACAAVYRHGAVADGWPQAQPLTAGALARRLGF